MVVIFFRDPFCIFKTHDRTFDLMMGQIITHHLFLSLGDFPHGDKLPHVTLPGI